MPRPRRDGKAEHKYLCLFHNTWHCRLGVPKRLQGKVGQVMLSVNLKTGDIAEAKRRRPEALAHMKSIVKKAERGQLGPVDHEFEKAIAWREDYERARTDEEREVLEYVISDEADDIRYRNADWRVDQDGGPADVERAVRFYQLATGTSTPLSVIIEKYEAVHSEVPPKTLYTRQLAFRKLLEAYPEATFENFTKADAVTYVDQLASMNPVTANTRLWPLSSLWTFAVKRQVCPDNVWRGLSMPTKRKGTAKRPLTDAEVVQLLTEADKLETPFIGDMWRFLLMTGCRIAEASNLKATSLEANFIKIEGGKTPSARRRIWVTSELFPVLGHRFEHEYVFHEIPEPPKDRDRSVWASKVLNRFRVSVGIDERPDGQRQSSVDVHSTRRYWATKALQAGISRDVVDACMGHASKHLSVGVYSGGFSDEQIRECFEAVKLP